MARYIVNKSEDNRGYHEVHNEDTCSHLPYEHNREYIGYHSGCRTAVQQAKTNNPYWKIDGCYYCSNECHQY